MAGIKGKYSDTSPNAEINPLIHFFFMSCLISDYAFNFQGLVGLAFAGSIGMTFVILACALPQYELWWPFFVVIFYILAPIPTLIARARSATTGSNSWLEAAIFITMGIVVSSFALPIVLARAPHEDPTIKWGACYLTLTGNVVVYATLLGFFLIFDREDDYSVW